MALRPTSDYMRETLFNVLGPAVEGARFIDIFAGTGAIGIEALSRGAAEAVFIENHGPAVTLIRKNLESLGIHRGATVLSIDATKALDELQARHRPQDAGFDFVYVDPPYAQAKQYERVLHWLGAVAFLSPNAKVIAEHRRTITLAEQFGALRQYRVLRQGDAALAFYAAT